MDINNKLRLATETRNGEVIGRDPREMEISELNAIGHECMPLSKIIRSKCLDCSHTESEVRKCIAFECVLWPYRMRKNPFSERVGNPDALAAARAARTISTTIDDECDEVAA